VCFKVDCHAAGDLWSKRGSSCIFFVHPKKGSLLLHVRMIVLLEVESTRRALEAVICGGYKAFKWFLCSGGSVVDAKVVGVKAVELAMYRKFPCGCSCLCMQVVAVHQTNKCCEV
jgi:hypothetical protein